VAEAELCKFGQLKLESKYTPIPPQEPPFRQHEEKKEEKERKKSSECYHISFVYTATS
jgi:hypothetical protein